MTFKRICSAIIKTDGVPKSTEDEYSIDNCGENNSSDKKKSRRKGLNYGRLLEK